MGRYGVGIGVYCIAALGRAAALGSVGMGQIVFSPCCTTTDHRPNFRPVVRTTESRSYEFIPSVSRSYSNIRR